MGRVSRKEIVAMGVLVERGETKVAVAARLGVSEGTVRYHLKREAEGAVDGRRGKRMKAEAVAEVVKGFMERTASRPKRRNLRVLHEELVELGYEGSYRSVVRYVRKRYGGAPVRPFRRVETPPGVQGQADWHEERVYLEDHGGEVAVHGFDLKLSYSRGRAVVWSLSEKQAAFQECHNGAFERLGGIPAVVRVDNLKTAVASGAGPAAVITEAYGAYAREMGFLVDPCRVRTPRDKGKVEREVRSVRAALDVKGRRFRDLRDLQAWTDRKVVAGMRRAVCPVTGKSVWESLLEERKVLRPLPGVLPESFDACVVQKVSKDCLVCFEGRQYSVPFVHALTRVEVRGYPAQVRIYAQGRLVAEHPRGTPGRLVIDPAHYDGTGTEGVIPPVPLGKMGRAMQELWSSPVQVHAMEAYARLSEVAR
ncbi:MAG: IS21 family transposase [Acidobacteriota bacterium]